MKLKGILCGLFALFVFTPIIGQAAHNSGTATLAVQVNGIKNDQGVVRIALFNSQTTYEQKDPKAQGAFKRAALPIKNGVAVWQVKGLPYGVYGIKLFHDEDNSGSLKKSFVGRPTEGVGFSNNPQLSNHAPRFDEVKFTVHQPKVKVSIRMINP